MEKVKVTVNIADRSYPMMANAEEEEMIRKASKNLNQMVKDFESKYEVRDKQDVLAMCAIQYTSKYFGLLKEISEKENQTQEHLQQLIQKFK